MHRCVVRRCKELAVEAQKSSEPLSKDLLTRIEGSLASSSSWTPQGLSMVVKSLARHRQRDAAVMNQVSQRFVNLQVNEQDVGNVANACAQLGLAHDRLISLFEEVLIREDDTFWKPQGFANLLNALSKLQVSLSFSAIDACLAIAKRIPWSRSDHVATVANALAKLQTSPRAMWDLPLKEFMPSMSPQGQSMVVNACARLDVDHPSFGAVNFAAFASEANEQHIALLLHGFARFRHRHAQLLPLARVRDARHWSMQGLSNVVLALASLDLDASDLIKEAHRRIGRWEESQHTINVALAQCLHDTCGASPLLRETLRIVHPSCIHGRDGIPASPMALQLWQVALSSRDHLFLTRRELHLLLSSSGQPPLPTSSKFQKEVTDALLKTAPRFVEEALVIPYVVDVVIL